MVPGGLQQSENPYRSSKHITPRDPSELTVAGHRGNDCTHTHPRCAHCAPNPHTQSRVYRAPQPLVMNSCVQEGADSISWQAWEGSLPGGDADFKPSEAMRGVRFTSDGGEHFEFPLLSKPPERASVTLENHTSGAVWFRIGYTRSVARCII